FSCVGSGVRRIIAKTGKAAYEEFLAEEQILKRIAQELKLKGISAVEAKVKQVIDENASLKKELGLLQEQLMVIKSKELKNNMQEVNGIPILIERLDGIDANGLKDIIANMKSQVEDCVCFFASVVEDKVIFVAGAGKKAIDAGIKCGDLVKEAALICDGKGGGRPDLAQAGGKNIAKVEEAFTIIKNKLGISL
nr:alanine--tRNA ligase [Erysipelotrichaceae bacterium]